MNAVTHMKVPTPFKVGAVNIYVVGDTLIDTGPKTDEALHVVKNIDLTGIKNIVLTHGHVDHHGLASYIREKVNCNVFVHEDDLPAVSNYTNYLEENLEMYTTFLEKTGISKNFIQVFGNYYRDFGYYGENCEVELLKNEFSTSEGVLKIIHTPGHTPGSCCFLLGDVLYSGDTLLPHISTNPSVHSLFDEKCGIEKFQKSLGILSQLHVKEVLPGHGGVITDHEMRIQEILKEHKERREKVISSLSEVPQSLVDVTWKIFGEVPASEIILALAECYDHLKILEKEGIITISEKGVYLFRLKDPHTMKVDSSKS